MHRNKYETNYAPNVPYIKNTTPLTQYWITSVQIMWAAKNPFRAPTYFLTPAPRSVAAPRPPAPRSAPFRRFSATPAHRSAPPQTIFGWLRSALRYDNKVQNIQN